MLLLLASLLLPAHADDDWKTLHAPRAEASSFLKSNWNKFTENYHPNYILDGNPRTAWVEGVPGNGEGSWIQWPVSRVEGVKRVKLRIRNGYHKSQGLLTANAAPRAVQVALLSQGQVVYLQQAELARALDWQEVLLDPPADVTLDGVRITVVAAHAGSAYADLCISDVETLVESDAPYSAPVENAKKQAALAWIAERVQAARDFAALPKTYPFASTQFGQEGQEVAYADPRFAALDAERAKAEALLASGPWLRLDARTRMPLPEGIQDHLDHAARWFMPDRTLFEAAKPWRPAKKPDDEWHVSSATSNMRVEFAEDGTTPVVAAFRSKDVWEERSTSTEEATWLVRFDGQGRPARILQFTKGDNWLPCDAHTTVRAYDLHWEGEVVDRVESFGRWTCSTWEEGIPKDQIADLEKDFNGASAFVLTPAQ